MLKPVSSVHVDIADFLLRVLQTPEAERGAWVTGLAVALAERDPSMHPYASKLLAEVEAYRKADSERKKRFSSKDSTDSTEGRIPPRIPTTDRQIRQTDQTEQLKNKTGTPSASPRFQKPTFAEVKAFCTERGNTVDPQKFLDHYEANGWKVGRNPMKDWKAAVRTWEGNGFSTVNGHHKPHRAEKAKKEHDENLTL